MEDEGIIYAEIDTILSLMEDKYVNKVPEEIIDLIKSEKKSDYEFKIDAGKPLENQNIHKETVSFITMLHLNYWCEDDFERNILIRNLKNKEINKKQNEAENKETSLVKYENNNFIKRLFNKIKKIFKR